MKELRRETCSLRAAFRNWLLFTAAMAPGPALFLGWVWMAIAYKWDEWYLWSFKWLMLIFPFLFGPEIMARDVIEQYAPSPAKFELTVLLVLLLARLCAVFAWGVFRLQRGKHAPYAQTLWILAFCAFRTEMSYFYGNEIPVYALLAVLVVTGVVVFVLQRRRPPAWKWKTPG